MSYVLINPTVAIYKEKRSEFIAYAKNLISTDELNNYLKELKSLHPAARHFCWAYRFAHDGGIIENSSDAGELSGSAGIPILNALKSKNVINCSIIVVRFFGGAKLGKRGLIEAYRFAAEQVIVKSNIQAWIPKLTIFLSGNISYYGNVLNIVNRFGGKIISDSSTKQFNLVVVIPEKEYSDFCVAFYDITQNSGNIKSRVSMTKPRR